jgi:protein-tyrosine phosphatase
MIDLHCHILPGIDDGAADIADAVAMAGQAEADGIALVCATPHIRHDHDVRIHELAGRVEEVNRELRDAGIEVRVITGGEVAETIVDHLDEDELDQVALGGGRWILLEPAPGPLSASLDEAVDRLASRGRGSLIAHPERHLAEDLPERLAALVERGALVQVTAEPLLGEDTAPWMLELARRGLVHVVASDSHSARFGRPLRISDALDRLGEVESLRPHLEWISRAAPAAIVAGDDVEPPYPPS